MFFGFQKIKFFKLCEKSWNVFSLEKLTVEQLKIWKTLNATLQYYLRELIKNWK